jgi:3-hydroxyacyl-[acyl-carrier-protein] dehydratase
MAQAGGVLSHLTMIDLEPKPLFFLAGVNNARFRRTVLPGDQLEINVSVERIRRGIWFYKCNATVAGKIAVAADIMCAPGGER